MPDSFATLRTVACQALLFLAFPRQEYWAGLPFPSPGDLPDTGIEFASSAHISFISGRFFTTDASGKPLNETILSHRKGEHLKRCG